MPAVKPTPKPPTNGSAWAVLYLENLEAMRLWYRRSRHPGEQYGHIVIGEMACADNHRALELALKGEHWVAPKDAP